MSYVTDWNVPGRISNVLADLIMGKTFSKRNLPTVSWTNDGTWTNSYYIDCNIVFQHVRQDVTKVIVDGITYTQATSKSNLDATAKSWYHDAAAGKLWIRPKAGVDLDLSVVVAQFKVPRSTRPKHFEGKHYIAHLLPSSGMTTTIECQDEFGGFVMPSSAGKLLMMNGSEPYYSYDGELADYRWLGVDLWNGVDTPWGNATWAEYVQVRSLDVLRVHTDSAIRVEIDLANKARKAKEKVAQLMYDHESPDADEEDYHSQSGYTNMDRERYGDGRGEGEMQPLKFGDDDGSGNVQKDWEEATSCTLVDQGTNGIGTKWKVSGRYVDHETDSNHGNGISAVLHKSGPTITLVPGANYTVTGETNTMITFTGSYTININDAQVRALTSGVKDVSGKFTGSGSSSIEKWHNAAHAALNLLGAVKDEEIDIAQFTASGVTKSGVAGTVSISDAWYVNCLYEINKKEDRLEDHLDVFGKSGRSVITEGNDGRFTTIQFSALRQNSDVSINADGVLGWREVAQNEKVYSRIIVEFSQRANGSKPRQVASRKKQAGADGTADVRNNFQRSWYGRRTDKVLKVALKTKAGAKALANVWRDQFQQGAKECEFTDITGACMQLLPGNRIILRRTRAAGGSLNEAVYWVLGVKRNYMNGTVEVRAMEAIA